MTCQTKSSVTPSRASGVKHKGPTVEPSWESDHLNA